MLNRRIWRGSVLALALLLATAAGAAAQSPTSPAVAPGAPSGLTSIVDRGTVSLFWTHATGAFTHYVIEAGMAPGETFLVFPTSAYANPSLLSEKISAATFSGVGAGTYYVRVRGANGAELGPATPDIAVTVSGSCVAPGVPTELTAISRTIPGQTFGWIQWNPGAGGLPTSYTLLAATEPGGAPVATFPLQTSYFSIGAIPDGTFYVTVVAQNACGQSAASAETVVSSPSSNLPARTPNPENGGRLPLPFVQDIVRMVVNNNPGILSLSRSCPGYSPNASQLVKYEQNQAINAIVDTLRLIDTRFGYNSKPTRGPADNGGQAVEIAGDEVAYHYGADEPEGSPNVHVIDLLSGHCASNTTLTWRNFTNGEFGLWTAAGRF